jgi:hypothetical protein
VSLGFAQSCLCITGNTRTSWTEVSSSPARKRFESAALAETLPRITKLENEVKILRKGAAEVERVVPPQARFA